MQNTDFNLRVTVCYVSVSATYKCMGNNYGAGFCDPITWDDGTEYYFMCALTLLDVFTY